MTDLLIISRLILLITFAETIAILEFFNAFILDFFLKKLTTSVGLGVRFPIQAIQAKFFSLFISYKCD